jgi:hypothetical protein
LIKLASYTWTKLSKEHDDMLKDILYNGIIQPFIYCKTPEIQLIFINFINELIEPLHIHIFKYLKGLVSIACEILPLPNHCARLSIMKMLFKLYSNAMPRFECYLPEILVAIAEAWRFGSSKELRAEMQDFVQLFRYKDSMQEDLDALISFDTTYNELIYTR